MPFTVLHHIGSTTLTVGSSGASLTVGASADLSLGMPKRNQNKSQKLKKCPWNKGRKIAKTHKQHVFIPREQLELFFAVALWFAGPVYAVALWLCLVTSRRISETLLLRGCDVMLHGGPDSDHPHIIYIQRPEDEGRQGNGKLGGERIVARVSQDVVETIEEIQAQGLHRNILPILEPYRTSHQKLFDQKPQRKDVFQFPEGNKYIFPAQTAKKHCRPNMARQTVSDALSKIRQVMFAFTESRRWNCSAKCLGNRVTVHGATRHTSAALLLFRKDALSKPPSESVIMEIQQRSDPKVFRQHYFHCDESELKDALAFGSIQSPFKRKQTVAPMEHPNETKDDDTVTVGPSGSKASKADHAVTVGSFGFNDDDVVIVGSSGSKFDGSNAQSTVTVGPSGETSNPLLPALPPGPCPTCDVEGDDAKLSVQTPAHQYRSRNARIPALREAACHSETNQLDSNQDSNH